MTISTELQQRYSSEVDVDWWEALILSHSKFTQTYYLANTIDAQYGSIDGATQTFQPVPFAFSWPARSDSGRGDMSVSIGAIGNEVTAEIERALEDPTERIKAQFTVYLFSSTISQYDPPIELSLTNIVATEQQISGQATNADTLNAPFPRVVYRGDQFPGLVRR